MAANDPIAFLSYVRADDEHDRGRITALRERLEGEVRMQTGRPFRIFQDKRDLEWGQQWKERLDSTLLNVTFLIPIITPGYFSSAACRDEFEKFLIREKQLGENRLILPIYYLSADEISDGGSSTDGIAQIVSSRNWADWRKLRFKDLVSAEIESSVAEMALVIKKAMKDLEATIGASRIDSQSKALDTPPPPPPDSGEIAVFDEKIVDAHGSKDELSSMRSREKYHAFTKEYDEIISAENLSDKDELRKLGAPFRKTVNSLRRDYAAEIVALKNNAWKKVKLAPSMVVILIDNSGSMRGRKILNVASWAYLLSEILESLDVKAEVLGFTTRAWKGGQSRERWITVGKPKSPGRLNDIRHIIYKDAETRSVDALENLSLMLRDGLLKENIDGEAILWAKQRLDVQKATIASIIVFSDGAPMDDSTLMENSESYLETHLIRTLAWLSKYHSQIKIVGVGVEHDISRYYENAVNFSDASGMGRGLLESVPPWLEHTI